LSFRKDEMIDENNILAGTLDWYTKNKKLLDKSVPQVVLIEKSIGESHFSLKRNEKFQLVFIHKTPDFVRKAVGDINKIDYCDGIRIQLTWSPLISFMKISDTTLEQNYFIFHAVQNS